MRTAPRIPVGPHSRESARELEDYLRYLERALRIQAVAPLAVRQDDNGIAIWNESGAAGGLEVADSTGTPDYTGVTKLIFQGPSNLTQPSGGNAQLGIFVASGGSHKTGLVPDPGGSAGTTHFLREDATWVVPPSGITNLNIVHNSAAAATVSLSLPGGVNGSTWLVLMEGEATEPGSATNASIIVVTLGVVVNGTNILSTISSAVQPPSSSLATGGQTGWALVSINANQTGTVPINTSVGGGCTASRTAGTAVQLTGY